MNKSLLSVPSVLLMAGACAQPLPPNVVSEPLGTAVLYRDTTFSGAQSAYIAFPEEWKTVPQRMTCLLKNGFRIVVPGKDGLPDGLTNREDIHPDRIVLSSRDTAWTDGFAGMVVWEKGPHIAAVGGGKPLLRLDESIDPNALVDLVERLVFERIPLKIEGSRDSWAQPLRRPEVRCSWGEVQKETFDFAVKDGDTLRLDVYRQPGFDKARPILLYSFGGGWQHGSRDAMDNPLFPFYTPMAQMGYVVVAIDYRLGFAAAQKRGELPSGDVVRQMVASKGTEQEARIIEACRNACLDAVEDLFDATSFVVEHAAEWGGDASRIVLCGGSAGACNSLQAEYLVANEDTMALEHLPEGFRFSGVIPCAGAIFPGGKPLTWKHRPAPILFFHGTADPIVPYGEGADFMGPTAIIASLPEQTPYVLYASKDQDHVMSGLPSGYMNHAIAAFIERYAVQGEQSTLHVEEILTDRSDPLVKRYLLSGYYYPREEVAKYYTMIYGPVPE